MAIRVLIALPAVLLSFLVRASSEPTSATSRPSVEALAADSACEPGDEACGVQLLQQRARRNEKHDDSTDSASGPAAQQFVKSPSLENASATKAGTCTASCGNKIKVFDFAKPGSWGSTEPEIGNPLCNLGGRQSPVDICLSKLIPYPQSRLVTSYTALGNLAVVNTGHNLEVVGAFGTLKSNDEQTWSVAQFHVHAPGEHMINGLPFPMELHIVHLPSGDGGSLGDVETDVSLASVKAKAERQGSNRTRSDPGDSDGSPFEVTVLGVPFVLGFSTNPCIKAMIYPEVPKESCTRCISQQIDLNTCFKEQFAGSYYTYDGSLTTPPCSQRVQWYLTTKPATITAIDYAVFKALAYGNPANNRPVQPLNGRPIYVKR